MSLLHVFSSAALLAALAPAQGVTYFVNAVSGSDANPGTRSLPLRSITAAVTLVNDDDRIVVLPGTYSPSLTGESYPIVLGQARSQRRVEIVGEGGPAATIVDGELMQTSSLLPILRFYWDAEGSSVTGLTFTNTGSADYWSMAIRCGSTSGAQFACRNIELHGNVFRRCHRAIVVFGTEPPDPNQTTGVRIHDNLFVDCAHRTLAIWGPGQNWVYSNTVVNSGHDSIWVDSLPTQAPSGAIVANNIVTGGLVGGIAAGPQGATALYTHNLAWQNANDYVGFTPAPSNLVADPLFVSTTDFNLRPGSPALQSGIATGLPVRLDADRMSRLHDSDGDGIAGLDRGCYQRTQRSMRIQGFWIIGGQVTLDFQAAQPGGGLVIFSLGKGAIPLLDFGVFAVDPATLLASVAIGSVPGQFPLPLPNDPGLIGATLYMQGGYAGQGIHLLHTEQRTF